MADTVTARLPRVIRSGVFAALCVALAACAHASMTTAELPSSWLVLAFAGILGCSWLLAGQRRGPLAVTGWMVALQGGLHQLFDTVQRTPVMPVAKPDWVSLLLCEAGPVSGRIDPEELARAAGLDPAVLPALRSGQGAVLTMAHGAHGLATTASGAADLAGTGGLSGTAGPGGVAGMAGMAGMAHSGWTLGDGLTLAGVASLGMVAAHLLAALACAVLFCHGDAAVAGLGRLLLALAAAVVPVLLLLPPTVRPAGPRCRPRRRERPTAEPVLLHVVVRRGPPPLVLL